MLAAKTDKNRAKLIFDSYQLSSLIGLFIFTDQFKKAKCALRVDEPVAAKQHETVRKDLPTYSADDVAKHADE